MKVKENSKILAIAGINSIIIIFLLFLLVKNYNTINHLSFQISNLQEELNSKNQQISSLQSELISKERTILSQKQQIQELENELEEKEMKIEELNQQISQLQSQIQSLEYKLAQTTSQLEKTTYELQETQRLLYIAKKYEERVEEGLYLSKAYKLLGDYDKVTEFIRENGITEIGVPENDYEIWERARDIYNWLGENYQYCSDKGFCIDENYCTQIQFFSPDELLYYGARDVLCGDCDDQAQLFVGMMYASGVPHDKVRVECGEVEAGGHCWAGVYVNGKWYKIDPVCAEPEKYISFFGFQIKLSGNFPDSFDDVTCFENYELELWYTPEEVHYISK